LNTFFKINSGGVVTIAEALEKWYFLNKRDLPWRTAKSAYEIWLAEIILQQTRVNQGLLYYHKFLQRFPDVDRLANAPLEDILKLWQGLGYYTRARNLHATAGIIVAKHKSRFPEDYNQLLLLKGIGEYTAAAIASIAFNIPVALVDGNVFRVLARLFGNLTPVDSPAAKKEFRRLAESILNKKNPGIHNQALMELGALVCLPRNPSCSSCPVHNECIAFKQNRVHEFPVKARKNKIRKRYFHYLHIQFAGNIFIRQRNLKDIWNSLYEFPLIETDRPVKPLTLYGEAQWKLLFNGTSHVVRAISKSFKHQLSHQTLHVKFYRVEIESVTSALSGNFKCIDAETILDYPVSRLTEKYLETLFRLK
jgi:A/G-specific adenine glycosylase